MGQTEVINFLKKCDKPVTRKQIADAIHEPPTKVSHHLMNLLRWSEVEFIEYSGEQASKMVDYFLNRRTRFYFCAEDY